MEMEEGREIHRDKEIGNEAGKGKREAGEGERDTGRERG